MIENRTALRVRYGETDKMGFVYYGVYPYYFEVGRTELIRSLGHTYKQLEDENILMPVISLHIDYKKPLLYDEKITIITYLKGLPGIKISFDYEILNSNNEISTTGKTTLAFIDAKKNTPIMVPEKLLNLISDNFK